MHGLITIGGLQAGIGRQGQPQEHHASSSATYLSHQCSPDALWLYRSAGPQVLAQALRPEPDGLEIPQNAGGAVEAQQGLLRDAGLPLLSKYVMFF